MYYIPMYRIIGLSTIAKLFCVTLSGIYHSPKGSFFTAVTDNYIVTPVIDTGNLTDTISSAVLMVQWSPHSSCAPFIGYIYLATVLGQVTSVLLYFVKSWSGGTENTFMLCLPIGRYRLALVPCLIRPQPTGSITSVALSNEPCSDFTDLSKSIEIKFLIK